MTDGAVRIADRVQGAEGGRWVRPGELARGNQGLGNVGYISPLGWGAPMRMQSCEEHKY
jgi:hypothetical protein